MADKQKKKAGGGAPSSTSSEAPSRQIEEIYGRHATSLQDASLAAQASLGEAQRYYLQSLHELHLNLQKELQNACQEHVKAREAAAGKEDAATGCIQADWDYAEKVNAAQVASRNKAEEIERGHRDKLEAVRASHSSSNEASYRSLVKDLQSVLGRVDPETVEPQHLNLISHLVLAATTGRGRQGSA